MPITNDVSRMSKPAPTGPPSLFFRTLPWIFFLTIPVLIWALWPYGEAIYKSPQEPYVFQYEILNLIKFYLCFFGLYLLPGLLILLRAGKGNPENTFLTPLRFLLAFALGMTAQLIAIFTQKYLGLSYSPWVVLACLAFAYVILYFFSGHLKKFLAEKPHDPKWDFITWGTLNLTLVLGMELVFRGRTSSVSLMGDAYGHLIFLFGTLAEGPLPNAFPFYDTFILNMYPLGWHTIIANLYTLIPGIEYIDLFRYYSTLMIPCFVFIFFVFFTYIAQSRPIGALATLALFFVSGGGMSLRVPIVYFPWYWSLAWCFTAIIFYLILRDGFRSKSIYFWAGILLGASVLMHPMMAPRMGTILIFYLLFEMVRRIFTRESLKVLFVSGGFFLLGSAVVMGLWVIPMVLQFGWEETYSYEYIIQNFSSIAPKAIKYLKSLKETSFGLSDLYPWTKQNAGIVPLVFSGIGVIAVLKRFKDPKASLLLGWVIAMLIGVLSGWLPNPYRYFETLFLGLMALSAFGMGWLHQVLTVRWRPLLLFGISIIVLWGLRQDYWPKYRIALHHYGRTTWSPELRLRANRVAERFYRAKERGTLNQDFGNLRGFLWPRQKKIWDIYIQNRIEENKRKQEGKSRK